MTRGVWLFLGAVLGVLYLPLIPPVLESFRAGDGFIANYIGIAANAVLMEGIRNTAVLGLTVAVITPLIALSVAQTLRAWGRARLILGLILLPLFVPGVSMGLATALVFQVIGLEASMVSIALVQILWALPFATLLLLTVMAGFDRAYLEAAHMLGAHPLRAFIDIELPQIWPGILGAGIFSLILSFNETIRTSIVQGGSNTVQTYLWSQYQQVGLTPPLYALMTLLIALTLVLVGLLAVLDRRLLARRQIDAADLDA